ncbi:MAG: cytochrome c oxidase assembly protein [Myxococcota bacterium]|nr:cytochrome c oxidase assembly protein [Myxococcota bacterium]
MQEIRLWSSPWSFEPFLVLSIILVAFVYLRGFGILQEQLPVRFPRWRRDAFLVGLALLYIALASPLDGLADLLLQAHMVQHWLLMMVVPPLLWLGQPSTPLLRGLPDLVLREGLGPLLASPRLKRITHFITQAPVAWIIWVTVTLLWHWPTAYEAALRTRGWHDFEHASFLSASLLLWYPLVRPWPAKSQNDHGGRLVYIGAIMLFNTLFSATFAFSRTHFYQAYSDVPKPFGISAIVDQNAAGAFMWIAGSIPMLIAAVILISQWLSPHHRRQPIEEEGSRRDRPGSSRTSAWILSPYSRRFIQFGLLFLAFLIVVDGLFGPPSPSAENLAGVLPWTYWRGFVVIGLLLVGNVFCAVCPFTLTRRLAAVILRRPFEWPRILRNKWLAAFLFILYLWAYEYFDLWDSPAWSAWLILGYFLTSFMVEGLFPRGTFCRYLCPIGQFNFTLASLSPSEVQAKETAICRGCKTQDCLRGNEDSPGCPTGLFLPAKAGNNDCTFCLDCVRACPHGNASLTAVLPARSIGQNRVLLRTPSLDWVFLCGIIIFGAFVNAAGMIEPVVKAETALANHLGTSPAWTQTLTFLLGVVVVPVLLVILCSVLSQAMSESALRSRRIILNFVPALIPMGFAMWLAHLGFHLVTSYASIVPATERALSDLTQGWSPTAGSFMASSAHDWTSWELVILGAGLLVSLGVCWRTARQLTDRLPAALKLSVPWGGLALLLYLIGVWIMLQPMEMRGMVM